MAGFLESKEESRKTKKGATQFSVKTGPRRTYVPQASWGGREAWRLGEQRITRLKPVWWGGEPTRAVPTAIS